MQEHNSIPIEHRIAEKRAENTILPSEQLCDLIRRSRDEIDRTIEMKSDAAARFDVGIENIKRLDEERAATLEKTEADIRADLKRIQGEIANHRAASEQRVRDMLAKRAEQMRDFDSIISALEAGLAAASGAK